MSVQVYLRDIHLPRSARIYRIFKQFYSLVVKPTTRVYTHHKSNFVSLFKCGDIVYYHKVDKKGIVIDKVFPIQSVKFRNRGNPTVVDIVGKEYNLKYCSLLNSKSLVFV